MTWLVHPQSYRARRAEKVTLFVIPIITGGARDLLKARIPDLEFGQLRTADLARIAAILIARLLSTKWYVPSSITVEL
jgi:hypothetical protein